MSDWERDGAFMRAAKLRWPEDARLATRYGQCRGRAAARRRMADRHEGFRLLRGLAALERDAAEAARELRGS